MKISNKEGFKKQSIPNMSLEILNELQFKEVLVFGCGLSRLPEAITVYHPEVHVTAYDIDIGKVNQASKRTKSKGIDYTAKKPETQFDVVLASAVLHENPGELAGEVISFLKKGGYVEIIDYDMKDYPKIDFFERWGVQKSEKDERKRLGDDEAHRIHTHFGLDDCLRIMEQNGIHRIFSKGKIKASLCAISYHPIEYFIYLGINSN